MFQPKLFGTKVSPSCSYCKQGQTTSDSRSVLCARYGVVAMYFSCKKYAYDPLKRVPTRKNALPTYNSEEFKL